MIPKKQHVQHSQYQSWFQTPGRLIQNDSLIQLITRSPVAELKKDSDDSGKTKSGPQQAVYIYILFWVEQKGRALIVQDNTYGILDKSRIFVGPKVSF